MAQVDSENSIGMPAPESPQDSFVSLAAAVSPAWHKAIVRLANASERVATKLGWVLENEQTDDPASEYVKMAWAMARSTMSPPLAARPRLIRMRGLSAITATANRVPRGDSGKSLSRPRSATSPC
jgi:hypothetical protein